jgi:dihydrofolate reductase
MVLLYVAMSLDGFIAGSGHDMSWTGGAEYDTSSQLADGSRVQSASCSPAAAGTRLRVRTRGALLPESTEAPGSGPVLLLTHHPEQLASDRTVEAVSDLETALTRAEELAEGRAVSIFGADVSRQVLALGRLDEIIVQIAPVLLGDGMRPFGEAPAPQAKLERTYAGTSGTLTDVRFRVAGSPTD